jgi:glycosyltransferase involved in cell wall biosynthesis
VLPYLEGHGTEAHALLLCRSLKEAGHEVALAAPPGPAGARFAQMGIPITPLPAITVGSFLPAMSRAARAAAAFDLVHVHAAQEFCGGLRWSGFRGPIVFTAHCYHDAIDYAKAGLFLNPFCSRVIAVSEAERERLARAGVRHLRKVLNGIDLEPFAGFDHAAVRTQLGLSDDLIVGIAVGRLARPKAFDVLLRALARTGRETIVLIAGEGPEERALRATAAALALGDRARFLGRREDLPRLLAAADFYVAPTRREGLSLAALEAAASGLPLIVSDIPEFREIVVNGENGLTFPVGRHESLAQAMSLLSGMSSLRATLSAASRKRVAEFDYRRMGQQTAKVYEEALEIRRVSVSPARS